MNLSWLRYGSHYINSIALNWLLNILSLCHQSAEIQYQKLKKYGRGIESRDLEYFYPPDRLMNIGGGQLTIKQKLLGQGHVELHTLPLLIFSMIQCDAFRPRSKSFDPSFDARCASAANMSGMSPSVLSRCIAPRIEMWNSGETSKSSNLNMTFNDIMRVIEDEFTIHEDDGAVSVSGPKIPLLLVDTPCHVTVYDCSKLCNVGGQAIDRDLPDNLAMAVQVSKRSYRVTPLSDDRAIRFYDEDSHNHLMDVLIEDSKLRGGESYNEWLDLIARVLHQ